MDIEFHYYITHLIAARAGFRGDDLRTLAYASQYTDDNNFEYKIQKGRNWFYNNRISQTMDILKPNDDRVSIYPLFHFIPGDSTAVYEQSDWYKFQEAVKQYAEMAEPLLKLPLTFVRQGMA